MVTLKDIATHVGVSASAVSLVLNGRGQGRVRTDVAHRIREVAEEMGYVPNLLARDLKTRQTHIIGLLSDQVASVPFAGQMIAGAQLAAVAAKFALVLIDTAGHAEVGPNAVRTLLQGNVEGLILAAEFHRDVELPLVPASIPIVVLDGRPRDLGSSADWVVPDEHGGAFTATQHLIEAGHRRIAFCNVSNTAFVARWLRRAGYEAALTSAGIPLDPALSVEAAEPTAAAGREAVRGLLESADPPSAVFCFSDQIALGVYQVAQQLGLEIPGDLSVVGFDNRRFVSEGLFPGLTTIELPHREMGAWAAQQVIARIRGTAEAGPVHRLMPCPLVERDSVGPPSAQRRNIPSRTG